MRRLLLLALMSVVMASGSACGFVIPSPSPEQEDLHAPRVIPSDPKLPKYDNPTEIDLEDGNLHISFKGVFRNVDSKGQPTDSLAFMFVAVSSKDMTINLDQSELFDGRAKIFTGYSTPYIAHDWTWQREILEGIPAQIAMFFRVPIQESELLPSVARVNIRFNGQWFQFRNIKAEEWQVWKELKQELGL